jgi:hypothetical protein
MSSLQLKRLSTTGRRSIVPLLGEPILDLTLNALYIGDGVTVGGRALTNAPGINKGPTTITSFTGYVSTVGSSTTVTFDSTTDAVLAGYDAVNPILGVTLITTAVNQASVTRFIKSWTDNLTCVVNAACTLAASSTLTSVQFPINTLVNSSGAVVEYTTASGVKVFCEVAAPAQSVENGVLQWSQDVNAVAGTNSLYMQNEAGDIGPIAFSNIREVEVPSSTTMGLNNVYDKRHINLGQTLDVILTFNASAAGHHGDVAMVTTVAKYFRLTPATGTYFVLDGSPLTVNQSVGVASAAEGQKINWEAVKIGAAAWRIWLWTVSGPWVAV